jgi:hypothetical protein
MSSLHCNNDMCSTGNGCRMRNSIFRLSIVSVNCIEFFVPFNILNFGRTSWMTNCLSQVFYQHRITRKRADKYPTPEVNSLHGINSRVKSRTFLTRFALKKLGCVSYTDFLKNDLQPQTKSSYHIAD